MFPRLHGAARAALRTASTLSAVVASIVLVASCSAAPESDGAAAEGDAGQVSQALNGYGWNQAWVPLQGFATSDPAVVSTADGKVHAFVRGGEGNLWENVRATTGAWSGWSTLGGFMVGAPSVVSDGYRIAAFARGGPSNHLFVRYFDGSRWSITWGADGTVDPWLDLGGSLSADPVATITTGSNPRIDVFIGDPWQTLAINVPLQYAWLGSQWSAWNNLGMPLAWDPAIAGRPMLAAASGTSCVDVVAIGEYDVNQEAKFTPQSARWCGPGTAWSGWTIVGNDLQLPGPDLMRPSARPAVFKWGDSFTGVLAMAQDKHFYYSFKAGTSWSAWQGIGGTGINEGLAISTPVVASWGTGDIEVFTQGVDLGLFHQTGTGAGNNWPSWTGWNEQVTPDCYLRGGRPALAAPRANHLDLVLVGSNHQLYYNFYDHAPSTAAGPTPPACQCGSSGRACCGNETCGSGLICNGSTLLCDPCGGAGQRCCEWPAAFCGGGLDCNKGRCDTCGGPGQPCCPGDHCNGSATQGVACDIANNVCRACGHSGQPCCQGSTGCDSGLACNNNWQCSGTAPPANNCGQTEGSACCTSGVQCQGQMQCVSGACHNCGGPGQACCGNGRCGSGNLCYQNQCLGCGNTGGSCCMIDGVGQCEQGYCDAMYNTCAN